MATMTVGQIKLILTEEENWNTAYSQGESNEDCPVKVLMNIGGELLNFDITAVLYSNPEERPWVELIVGDMGTQHAN